MPKFPLKFDALADRPLIWLLPFYLAGIALGWDRPEAGWRPLLLGAAVLPLAVVFIKKPTWRLTFPLLATAALLLGWGLCSRSLIPPGDESHLLNFTAEAGFERTVILGGRVLEGSDWRPGSNHRLLVEAREIIVPGAAGPEEARTVTGLVRVTVGGGERLWLEPGDYLRVPLTLGRLAGFKNPGLADYDKFWAARGVWVGGFVKSPLAVTSWAGAEPPWGAALSRWRSRAVDFIERETSAPVTGLLAAQLVGRRSAVDRDSEEVYRALGLSHLLSVSGLHLSVWYGLCYWLIRRALSRLRPTRVRATPLAGALALLPALAYAALAGASSPVIRSAVMIVAVVLAALILRRADPWTALAAAAWIPLLAEPYRLFTASFQLSFAATAALLAVFIPRPGAPPARERPAAGFWTAPLDRRWLKNLGRRLKLVAPPPEEDNFEPGTRPRPPSFFRNALLASLAGTLGTAPLVVRHFGRLPLAGLPANVIFTGLLSTLVLLPGLTALALLPCSPALASWPLALAAGVQGGLLPVMSRLAEAVGPGWVRPAPGAWFLLAWFAAGWVWLRSPRPWKVRSAAALVILAAGWLPGLISGPGERGVLRFTVLDVGQGSSVHLNFPDGRQMLVDGGGGYNFDPGETLIGPYLRRQGLSRLDVMALTHPDQDHLQGLVKTAEDFRPKELWDAPWPEDYSPVYREFRKFSAGRRVDLSALYEGRNFGPARVRLLWPPPELDWPHGRPGTAWVNDHGLVLKVEWGEISFLITGDLGPRAEAALAERYGRELKATVVTAPHHGGLEALSPAFLAATEPEWLVFSVGRRNRFGHPHPETLRRARASGAKIRRTDLEGAAVFEVRLEGGRPKLEELPFRSKAKPPGPGD